MLMTNYGRVDGIIGINQVPILNTHGGDVFWVDSNGSTASKGTFANPVSTIDDALGLCTNDKGDTIIIKENHSETITGAGGITLDKSGVSIYCLGHYNSRPAFLMDGATTVTLSVTADNVLFTGGVFKAGHADIVKFADIAAKGFTAANNSIIQNATNENFKTVFSVGTADNDSDGLALINNEIIMGDAADLGAITINKNMNDVKLIGNRIIGDFDASPFAPIYAPATEIMLNILVEGNYIHNQHDADAAVGISIANTASTGWIIRNHVGHQDLAGETPILAGAAGLYVGENYASGVLGTASGYLYPAADS